MSKNPNIKLAALNWTLRMCVNFIILLYLKTMKQPNIFWLTIFNPLPATEALPYDLDYCAH